MSEWLKNLKSGDEVVVDGRWQSIGKVSRTTKTLIIVEQKNYIGETFEIKFRSSDGFELGSSGWCSTMLRELTPERALTFKHKSLCQKAEKIDMTSLSIERLEAILAIANNNSETEKKS